MASKIILVLLSDNKSTSESIILKSLKFIKKQNLNYLFIGNIKFFTKLAKKLFVINDFNDFNSKKINFFNISKNFNSKYKYINAITDAGISLLKKKLAIGIINMPLNKEIFGKKISGYTEFFAKKLNQIGKENMLLFNEALAVCPLTTHIPLRKVHNFINKKKIITSIKNINFFYKKIIKKKINIKVCGLNPHAGKDFLDKNTEEKKIIIPLLKKIIKKNKNVSGPYSADTIFLKCKNSVVLGMYHDQVLAPFKAIKGYNAINVTIGLKYLRVTPDHGTGLDVVHHKSKISNESFKCCIKFYEKYLNV